MLISAKDETIYILTQQLEAERQAHAEARRLLAAALERIPALEAPHEPESSSEPSADAAAPPEAEEPSRDARPWWRRVFGG
jgi:hypothetical protein